MTQLISDRTFENMVNNDLRDKDGVGDGWAVLRAPVNRLRWLSVLAGIRRSIIAQNGHEIAALRAHPDRCSGKPSLAYLQAKQEFEDRKRTRLRTMQAVEDRITEAQQLTGTLPVSNQTAGLLTVALVEVDRMLTERNVDGAQRKLRSTLRHLTGETTAEVRA